MKPRDYQHFVQFQIWKPHDYCNDVPFQIVKLLVSHNADIDAIGENGDTSLRIALRLEHKSIYDFLLEKGADTNL